MLAGISAMLVTSRLVGLVTHSSHNASRTIGCSIQCDLGDTLKLGIFDNQLRSERLMKCDHNVLIDGRRDQKSAMFVVVGGQIGAAPAQSDAQRTPGDDHAAVPL